MHIPEGRGSKIFMNPNYALTLYNHFANMEPNAIVTCVLGGWLLLLVVVVGSHPMSQGSGWSVCLHGPSCAFILVSSTRCEQKGFQPRNHVVVRQRQLRIAGNLNQIALQLATCCKRSLMANTKVVRAVGVVSIALATKAAAIAKAGGGGAKIFALLAAGGGLAAVGLGQSQSQSQQEAVPVRVPSKAAQLASR